MSVTKPTSDQIRFRSRQTGDHLLDTYLEAMEKGGRSVPDILDDLFDESGNLTADIEFRFNTTTFYLQYRHGSYADPATGWQDVDKFKFFEHCGEYTPGTHYISFDVVTLNDNWYICHTQHTALADFDDTKFHTLYDATAVQAIQSDVTTRHNDVITRHNDIINRQTDINADAATHLANIQSTGDTQTARVTTEGDAQYTRVATEGDQKVADATAQAQAAADANTDVQTRQADVQAMQLDVQTRQSDITVKHSDVVDKHTEVLDAKNYVESLSATLQGSIVDGGSHDASTNTAPATPTLSTHWKITAAGTVNGIDLGVGDSLVFTTSTPDNPWYKIDNTESVTSVNNKKGVVTLSAHDVGTFTQAEIDAKDSALQSALQSNIDAKPSEAPNDGSQYVRKNQSWEQVSVDVNEAPNDNEQYVRKNQSWEQVSVDVNEAPNDGKLYFRHNGQWTPVEDTYLETTPVGITALWDGSATAPAGWLECDGSEIFENQYPELFTLYKDKVQTGKAFLPDHRGEFLRGWDNGRGVDAGRALGSHQGDEFKEHDHEIRAIDTLYFDQNYTSIGVSAGNPANKGIVSSQTILAGGTETRPRNNAVMVIIKAVAGPNLLSQIAVPQRSFYNATAGQQSFNHLYETGRPLAVFMNGVKLIKDLDFSASNGTSIDLNSPLVADADLEIESFGKLVLSDMIGDSVHDGESYVRKDGVWVPEKIVDYALLDFGTVTNNNRYVQSNPFGNNTPVGVVVEIQLSSAWADPHFFYTTGSGGGRGVTAGFVEGEGIVVRTASLSLNSTNTQDSGGLHSLGGTVTSAPCRVHVWRVGV